MCSGSGALRDNYKAKDNIVRTHLASLDDVRGHTPSKTMRVTHSQWLGGILRRLKDEDNIVIIPMICIFSGPRGHLSSLDDVRDILRARQAVSKDSKQSHDDMGTLRGYYEPKGNIVIILIQIIFFGMQRHLTSLDNVCGHPPSKTIRL